MDDKSNKYYIQHEIREKSKKCIHKIYEHYGIYRLLGRFYSIIREVCIVSFDVTRKLKLFKKKKLNLH